jgi:hypothetical protein
VSRTCRSASRCPSFPSADRSSSAATSCADSTSGTRRPAATRSVTRRTLCCVGPSRLRSSQARVSTSSGFAAISSRMTAGGSHTPPAAGPVVDAGEPLADPVGEVRDPADAVGPGEPAEGVAGPLERPVGVQLAEDVVLVLAAQRRRPAGDWQRAPSAGGRRRRRGRRGRGRRRSRRAGGGGLRRRSPSPTRAPARTVAATGLAARWSHSPSGDEPPRGVKVAQLDRVHHASHAGSGGPHLPYTPGAGRAPSRAGDRPDGEGPLRPGEAWASPRAGAAHSDTPGSPPRGGTTATAGTVVKVGPAGGRYW